MKKHDRVTKLYPANGKEEGRFLILGIENRNIKVYQVLKEDLAWDSGELSVKWLKNAEEKANECRIVYICI